MHQGVRFSSATLMHRPRALQGSLAALLTLTCFAVSCASSPDEESDVVAQALSFTGALPALNLDLAETTASGLSSGAFMAVQFHVAFSASMRGVAVFAGGPYDCAQGSTVNALTRGMSPTGPLDATPFIASTNAAAARGAIDAPSHLAAQRVFLFGGANDTTVKPAVMDALRDYYRAFVEPSNVAYVERRPGTGHTMPTVDYGGPCATTASPYIGACGFDGAGEALRALYGPLAPKQATTRPLVRLSQRALLPSANQHSLDDIAYAYVPASCEAGGRCRVHVAFHGCEQQASGSVGDRFVSHAGYNEWAEANAIVVLYPQTIATSGKNPHACWDWWGYDSPAYATKSGPQLALVKSLVDGLAGASPAASDGGADRDASLDGGGNPDAPAPAIESSAECTSATAAAHVVAGRARLLFGFAYAVGTGEALAWAFDARPIALLKTANGFRRVDACP